MSAGLSQFRHRPNASQLVREPGERASGNPSSRTTRTWKNPVLADAILRRYAMVITDEPGRSGLSQADPG